MEVGKKGNRTDSANQSVKEYVLHYEKLNYGVGHAFAIGYSIYAPMWAQVVLGTSATMAGGTQIFSSIAVMLATSSLLNL